MPFLQREGEGNLIKFQKKRNSLRNLKAAYNRWWGGKWRTTSLDRRGKKLGKNQASELGGGEKRRGGLSF